VADQGLVSSGTIDRAPTDWAPRRVLHVVLKFSSGVGSAIAQYTRSVPEVEHHLLSGTAVDAEGDLADHAVLASTHRMLGGHLDRVRRVRDVVRELRPDVVHAHSSHAGVYARLAVSRHDTPLVYTPHCYAFERRDVAAPVRAAFWLAEALLAVNTSAFAACSERERQLSAWPTRRAQRVLVPNIAPAVTDYRRAERGPAPLVVGGGRLSPQKDPAYFLEAVRRLRAQRTALRAVWLGDGDPALRDALAAGGVEVSGWLPRAGTLALLGSADLYLHSARWEGFPVMVAEAAALGVPTLVRRLPCFVGVPVQLTLDEALEAAEACLDDPEAAKANVRGWEDVLATHTLAEQRRALTEVYTVGRVTART
jgi:glycosyltransferase involved in cell wall biosynthesis